MKCLIMLFLALLCVVPASAVHRHIPSRHRVSTPRKTPVVVPWKTVAAGGAAAGTLVAAYKVSDGVEEGIKTVAKEKPEAFADSLSVLTWPVRWAAMILFLVFGCGVAKKWLEHKTNLTRKEKT